MSQSRKEWCIIGTAITARIQHHLLLNYPPIGTTPASNRAKYGTDAHIAAALRSERPESPQGFSAGLIEDQSCNYGLTYGETQSNLRSTYRSRSG